MCLKLWDGECKLDNTVNAISAFLRKHFLRAYYNNRAPLIFHFTATWLKNETLVAETEILPNFGFANQEKRVVVKKKIEYRNLDGLAKFIDETLENNRDVYFVTAQQVVQWMKALPRFETEKVDLIEFIENELTDCNAETNFDGKCDYLKKSHFESSVEEEELYLDDDLGIEQRDKENKILIDDENLMKLQSEILFLNRGVLYFVFGLVILVFFIVLYDKYV